MEQELIRMFTPQLNATYNYTLLDEQRAREYRQLGKRRKAYRKQHRIVTQESLQVRAYQQAIHLAHLRCDRKDGTVTIHWIDKEGRKRRDIREFSGMTESPVPFIKNSILVPNGFLEQARQLVLSDYKLIEEYPDYLKGERPTRKPAARRAKGGAR